MFKEEIRAKRRAVRSIPDQRWTDHLTVRGQILVQFIAQPHIVGRIVCIGIFIMLFVLAITL